MGMGEMSETVTDGLFAGEGEMFERMRSLDWAATPVGPVSGWSQSLKTAVSICLGSRHPIEIWWGPDYLRFYNDAYRPILGQSKHPQFIGRSGRECWAEIWNVIGPMLDSVRETGIPTWSEDLQLLMTRNGYIEETYFTFSYSPIRDETGGIGGIFSACSETTKRVLGERRLQTLRQLATQTAETKTVEEACCIATQTLAANPHDIPFALLYLVDAEKQQAHLTATAGIAAGTFASPSQIDLSQETQGWNLTPVATGEVVRMDDLIARFGALPGGAWSESPSSALVMPLAKSGQRQQIVGLLIMGISPHREFDDDYQGFFDLVASSVATAIANASAYEEERQRAEALAELNRAKTAFFSNVSHEFRTPLTLLLGPLEDTLTHHGDQLPSDVQEPLKMAQRNGLRLLKLVNTLLDFSQIEAGRIQATYEPTNLPTLTAELANVFRSAAERAGLRLTIECPPLPELMYVDHEMWEKIVFNLLSNAFKFTFEGEIAVRLRWADNHVELSVQDTGIGIPTAELPHLFERFHRVKESQGRTIEGSGIGLSLVQELVKLHGGTIVVTSTMGSGSCFTVSIPTGHAHLPSDRIGAARTRASTTSDLETLEATFYAEEAVRWLSEGVKAEAAEVEQSEQLCLDSCCERSTCRARILLAEDNADMRDYIQRLLNQQYEVETVSDGIAALTAIRQQPPDLVLTDVMMPELDGFELLRQIRNDAHIQEIPVVLLSARAGEESRVEGLEAGADDYLIKPFSARELLARVEASLKLAQIRQEMVQRERELRFEAQIAKEQLSQILESVTDGFMAFDREWRFTYLNHEGARTLGRDLDDLLGKNLWEEFPELAHTSFGQLYQRAMVEGTVLELEDYYPPFDAWFSVRAYPSEAGLSLYFRNITDRKQVEAVLQQRESELRLITNTVPVLISFVDAEQRYRFNNRTYEEWFGHPASEIYGKTVQEVLGDAAYNLLRPYVEQVLAGHQLTFESQIPYKDGGTRFVKVNYVPRFNSEGTVEGYVALVIDVSDRKRAEAQIRQQAVRLQRLSQAALTINSTLSLDEIALLITEQARDIIGAHQSVTSMMINQDWAEAIHTVSLSDKYVQWRNANDKVEEARLYSLVRQMQRPMRMTQAELEAHPNWQKMGKAAGNHAPMRGWLAAPLTSRTGDNIGLIQLSDKVEAEFTEEDEAILVQLSQMASAAIDNASLYEESQRANRIKDEFLAVLSHELRSPLNPILGWTRLLRTRKFDPEATDRALETIERNAKLQTQLIEDLLDVSRILRGKLILNVAPVDLAATIEAALETVRLAAEAKGIQIQLMLSAEVGLISGDAARLQQVIWNLLSNAVKFTPAGGQIEVRLERDKFKQTEDRSHNQQQGRSNPHFHSSYAQIIVTDTGKGIAPEFLPYVFEYFRQEDGKTTRKFGGLGLGLAIVRHITELHGGTVRAESRGEGQGATFTVRLPLLNQAGQRQKDEASLQSVSQSSYPSLAGLRILVVDDEPDMRELLGMILEQAEATVNYAASAAEALLALVQLKPDVLVSDIGMPEIDGYMLMRQVRSQIKRERPLPAIALTAYAGELNQQQALSAGFDRHLSKPIDPEVIVTTIASLIKGE